MRGGRARFNIGASLHTCGLAELEDIALSLEDIALSLEDIAISLPLGAAWRWMQRYAVCLSKILLYLSKILLYLSKILLYLSKILLYLDFISSNHSPHVRHRYTRSPPPHYLPLVDAAPRYDFEAGNWQVDQVEVAPLGPSGVVPAAVATATDSPQGWGVVQTP